MEEDQVKAKEVWAFPAGTQQWGGCLTHALEARGLRWRTGLNWEAWRGWGHHCHKAPGCQGSAGGLRWDLEFSPRCWTGQWVSTRTSWTWGLWGLSSLFGNCFQSLKWPQCSHCSSGGSFDSFQSWIELYHEPAESFFLPLWLSPMNLIHWGL